MNTIGVLGGRWRASVSAAGSIRPWDGSTELEWFIAADDRWHIPTEEPTIRQRRLAAAPVIETRIKVPTGDAVHRVWCVADADGLTIVEIENDSSLPIAVAFNRGDLLSSRPPTGMPVQGIDLPEGSVVFPMGHHSAVRFGLAHGPISTGRLPGRLPSAMQVARGWTAIIDGAGRLVLPDDALMDTIAKLRSELALNGPASPADDAVGFLIGVGQLVRLGEQAERWVPDIAAAVPRLARMPHCWDTASAIDGAATVLARAGERRALRDVVRLLSTTPVRLPTDAPADRLLAWHEQRLARSTGAGAADLLGGGIPAGWLGAGFEVHGLPVGPSTTVSYAVRWHGDRPAVLWETDGPAVLLTASAAAPGWSTAEPNGEALWPAPTPLAVVRFGQDTVIRVGSGADSVESHHKDP